MTAAGPPTRPAGSSRRSRTFFIIVAVVLAVVTAAVAVFFATRGAGAEPVASSSPSPTESAAPSAAPSPSATTVPAAIALPDECEDAFSPEYFALRSESVWNPLNHESVADSRITDYAAVEELRAGLPQLRCTWAVAGEEGILSSIADVTAAESGRVILLLEEEGYDCVVHRQGTACSIVLGTNPDNGRPVFGEEHFFRDNIWIAAFWANIDIVGYNDDIIDTLWGSTEG
ncbi:hypothetical protein IWX78_001931 [Mycetocola sp. CAN_C7]|uniref:hypothetical protein n=1 Tax=Mycetocola sp. CAN_C7 TaxID=2787724 RepID=UPI0018CA33FD